MRTSDLRIRDLLELSGLTLQIRCDMADVVSGLRPTARLMVRPGAEAETCARAIVRVGLSVAVGHGVKWQPRREQVGVVDWMGEAAASRDVAEKFIVLYVALTQSQAGHSRAADETRNDAEFGNALGYPACCVQFVNDRGRVPEHKDVFALYASHGHYDPLCWPGAMALDRSLLIHYPCSVSCATSRRMAESRWRYIRDSGCEAVVTQVRDAHGLVYWLDRECRVRAGAQAPDDAVAVATPNSALT
jgi:hypothetical protein